MLNTFFVYSANRYPIQLFILSAHMPSLGIYLYTQLVTIRTLLSLTRLLLMTSQENCVMVDFVYLVSDEDTTIT